MTGFLKDPRGRRSEELAFEAERAHRAGDQERARALYAQAAELEGEVAREVPDAEPRVRSVLAISAVALWLEAGRHDDAARAACEFLARPEALTEQGKAELEALLSRAFRERGPAKVASDKVQIEGVLKVINLRARPPYIGVETADGDLSQFFIEPGRLDDTLGSKLNRRVRVSGVRRQKPDGRIVKDALDVELVEEKAA